jgi:protease I
MANEFKIAILATNGFEQSELEVPLGDLRERGATVHVVSLEAGEIKGWDEDDWGSAVPVDKVLGDVDAADYDALVLPGGQINPDLLRVEKEAVALVKAFAASDKPVAAICHAPWLLVEADLLKGRRATSYHSIRKDVENAGADWQDEKVVRDGNLITSRKPDDLSAFVDAIWDALKERGGHRQAAE